MKHISTIKTFDGAIHNSQSDAIKHLDKVYDKELTRIGIDLCNSQVRQLRHSDIMRWVDEHLDRFVRLSTIKADYKCEPKPEYWEE